MVTTVGPRRDGRINASAIAAEGQVIGGPTVAVSAGLRAGLRAWADRIGQLERWTALPCAVLLLLYPNPLVVPSAVVGLLPALARWVAYGRPWPRTAFDLPLMLLVVGSLLGAWAGLSPDGAAVRLTGLLAGLILYGAIVEHADSPRRLRLVVLALLAVVWVGTLALLVTVAPFLRLDRVPPLAMLVGALDPTGIGGRLSDADWLLQRYRLRGSGVGAMADVGLALVFATSLRIRSRNGLLALAALAVFFGAALVAADNRGSMLAGAVTIAALIASWRARHLVLVPLAVAVTLALIAAGLVQRGLNLRTLGQRFWFWENSLYLVQELPLTGAGIGIDSVQRTYRAYFQPINPEFSHAHSIYLQALLETGVIGVLGLLGLVAATLWAAWRWQRVAVRGTPVGRSVHAAALAGLGVAIALFTAGLSEMVALTTVSGALLLAGLALLAAATLQIPEIEGRAGVASSRSSPRNRRPWMLALAAAAAIVLLLGVTGAGARAAALALTNFGTVALSQATIAEDTVRADRTRYLERAVGLLRMAASLDPASASVQRNLAMALAAQDDRRARAAADRAKALTPVTDRRGQFQLGRAYAAMSAWGETIRAWQAAEARPQLLRLGSRLVRARNWEQALAAYMAAAVSRPSSRAAIEGIAEVARERSDTFDEAITAFDPLLELGGLHEYYATVQIIRMYRQDGQPLRALELIRRVPPEFRAAELILEHGIVLSELGRWSEAEQLLSAAVAADPNEPEAFYRLGDARVTLNNFPGAVEAARAGLAVAESGSERAPLLGVMGEGLLALGRPAEALAAFEEAAELDRAQSKYRRGATRARTALELGPSG